MSRTKTTGSRKSLPAIVIGLAVILSVFFLVVETRGIDIGKDYEIYTVNRAVMVTAEGERQVSCPLKYPVHQGDSVTMRFTLRRGFDEGTHLMFSSRNCEVFVALNGEQFYEHRTKSGDSIFGIEKIHTLLIPEQSGQLEIAITYQAKRDATLVLQQLYVGSTPQITLYRFMVRLLLDSALLVVGLFWVIAVLFQRRRIGSGSAASLAIGVFIIMFALWMRLGTPGIPPLWINRYGQSILSYILFLLMPIPYQYYMSYTSGEQMRPVFRALAVLTAVNVAVVTVLHIANILYLDKTLVSTHVIMALTVVCFAGELIRQAVKKETKPAKYRIGFYIFLASALVELLIFYVGSGREDLGLVLRFGIFAYLAGELLSIIHSALSSYEFSLKTQLNNEELKNQLLLARLRPHFLYNTLGAITYLTRESPDRAVDALKDFSHYVRQNMENMERMEPIRIQDELDYVETYLRLETLRFGDRLRYKFIVDVVNFDLPPYSLQIFAENAVKHGVMQREEGGLITIRVTRINDINTITISDDGVGFDVDDVMAHLDRHLGIRSAKQRIESVVGGELRIESTPDQGTLVTILIQDQKGEEYENHPRGR